MRIREHLVCPECKARLSASGAASRCPNGHQGYVWSEGRAIFDIPLASEKNTDNPLDQGLLKRISRFRIIHEIVTKLMSVDVVYKTRRARRRIPSLATQFRDKLALNVGSGTTDYGPQFLNVDIGPFEHVHVVTTSERLPFPDNHFDLVICQAVLEHVPVPTQSVQEMIRVLKTGGELYVEIPFIQGFHPTPHDYQRYTITGIEHLCRGVTKIEKGIVNGPASALCWILREFLAMTFSFTSQTLYKMELIVFGWLVLPLKFLDGLLEGNRFAPMIASGFFFHGRKH